MIASQVIPEIRATASMGAGTRLPQRGNVVQ
jgi:hypothetical protein